MDEPSMSWLNVWQTSPITPTPCTGCSKRQSSRALWPLISRSVPAPRGKWVTGTKQGSVSLATQWWQRSARLGNTNASYRLGLMCQEQHQGKLASECLDWFEQAAKRDHAEAQLVLAKWYGKQPGADADSIKWLERAAELGNRDAQFLLGERYTQDKGFAKRSDLAQRWNDKAAAQQQPDALLQQAKQAAPANAFAAYQCAATAGSAEAELWLGMAYLAGKQVPTDPALGRY